MRINCHTHIFNLQSVFTSHTLDTLINRIKEFMLPDFIAEALINEIRKVISKTSAYTDEEQLLRNVVNRIQKSDKYNDLLKRVSNNEIVKLDLIGIDKIDNLAVNGLKKYFKWLGNQLFRENNDAGKSTVIDAIDFLRIALLPSISRVTDNLISQLKPGDSIIALMMDITKDGSDNGLYEKQLEDTSNMVLAYPGRIFPFVAVNPRRPDHYEIMEHSIQSGGFTGVKLYPSLGYDIDSDEMNRVYAYCSERNIPLLMHCTKDGFYYRKQFRENTSPDLWPAILERFPTLKICFGHFGGGKNLVNDTIHNDSWPAKILKLMNKYAGVYADISFHTDPMKGGKFEENYFKHLKKLMGHPVYRRRLLFGTDYFLVRSRLKEKNHWKYFEDHFSTAMFNRMSEQNPVDFMGLRKGNKKPAQNINNYVRFIYLHRDRIERKPSPWLSKEIKEIFGQSASLPLPSLGSRWAWNNDAHYRTWSFMLRNMRPSHKNLKFRATGRLRLRQMQYWNKEFEAMDIWNKTLRAMAENMDAEFRANNATFEEGYSMKKTLDCLVKEFDKGELALFELAEICDKMYQFKKERG